MFRGGLPDDRSEPEEKNPCATPSPSSTWSATPRWSSSARWPRDVAPLVLAKIEYVNPGGSVKDRIALKMITAAEESGELRPGGTIVEPTSGNTGVGLALVAQQRGYHCIFVCPDKVSEDKRNVLRAYGAEVVVCPTAVAPEDPNSYYSVSDRLVRETPGAWKPDQYSNPQNPASHYETTGPEIWADTDGKVTHFVAGVGTGGTISGTGRYLKEVSGGRVKVIGADPEGSVYSGGTGRPYLVEGSARTSGRTPTTRRSPTRSSRSPTPSRSPSPAGWPARRGCWSAVPAGWRSPRHCDWRGRLTADDVVVVILPDGGRGYLSKIFSDGVDGVLRIPGPGRRGNGRRGAARQERPAAVAGAHPSEGDRPRRGRDHARIRRLADAGGRPPSRR